MTPLPLERSPAAGPGAKFFRFYVLLALASALAAPLRAQAAEPGLAIRHPWVRAIMPTIPAAGYFTLTNATAAARTLVGASSPDCGMLMLHRSISKNGLDRMAIVKSIIVPAHGGTEFSPGGYHLMCMSPSKNVSRGHTVPVTLRFADGGSVTTMFPVRGATGK